MVEDVVDRDSAEQVVRVVHGIRADSEMLKPPGVAETLDWARALHELGTRELDTETAAATLGVAVKYREDAEPYTAEEAALERERFRIQSGEARL